MSALIKSADLSPKEFNEEQLGLIKNIICKGASDDEIAVFIQICKHTRLDPIAKQIWMIGRLDGKAGKTVYTPQVSIDGARLIADRTGKYAPGKKTEFEYKPDGSLLSATAYVKKLVTSDNSWHEVSATAYFDEYVQTYKDNKTGEKKVMGLWASKSHTMLAKVAENMALKRAFPSEMSGVYVEGELDKDVVDVAPVDEVTQAELNELYELSVKCPDLTQKLKEHFKITGFNQLNKRQYEIAKKRLIDEVAKQISAVMEGE